MKNCGSKNGSRKLINKIEAKLFKILYWPICRVYARHLGDQPADALLRFLCALHFWRVHRYWPNFANPHSFSEKVWHRMLFDRNPRLTLLSDKLRVRNFVAKKVGNDYLVPLIWKGDNPEEIPFAKLPSKFVIKATHGCKYNIIVDDKSDLDQTATKLQLKKWLAENSCQDKFLGTEWAYKNIEPHIIVESFLDDKGKIPLDYKFYCFSGRVEFLLIIFDRFGYLSRKHLDRHFNPLDLWKGAEQYKGEISKPDNYEDMIRVAEALTRDFDFMRVDLYSVGSRIYFGELTCYPAGGDARFVPMEYDFQFGEKWK